MQLVEDRRSLREFIFRGAEPTRPHYLPIICIALFRMPNRFSTLMARNPLILNPPTLLTLSEPRVTPWLSSVARIPSTARYRQMRRYYSGFTFDPPSRHKPFWRNFTSSTKRLNGLSETCRPSLTNL
jgi:hypothetical protein